MTKTKYPTEHEEQCDFVLWFNSLDHPASDFLFAVPNGSRRHYHQALKLKAEGLRSGVPDIWIPYPVAPWHGLVIEFKRQKGGTVSSSQKEWIERLSSVGYFVEVAKGCDEAIAITQEYLNGEY